jgi:hypothetical protein
MFVMHRFLASDPAYAQAARELQRDLNEPTMTFRVWQGLLPRERGAPKSLVYTAPKRAPEVEELVGHVMRVENVRRAVAENVVVLIEVAGGLAAARAHYGVEG